MKRQIYQAEAVRSGTDSAANDGTGTQDLYFERLLKLIPGETVAVYLFIDGILKSALSTPEQSGQLQIWLWMIFGILFIGNILYLKRFNQIKDITQLVILSLAFVVWIFTVGGPFVYLSFYQPFIGSVILGLFTFLVPIFYKGVPVNQPAGT